MKNSNNSNTPNPNIPTLFNIVTNPTNTSNLQYSPYSQEQNLLDLIKEDIESQYHCTVSLSITGTKLSEMNHSNIIVLFTFHLLDFEIAMPYEQITDFYNEFDEDYEALIEYISESIENAYLSFGFRKDIDDSDDLDDSNFDFDDIEF